MAKVVIAGHSDCPYFARIELLGDRLVKNLPSFQLHKIVKTPTEWEDWLNQTCQERGWQHKSSPVVWRELIDRGGKGAFIGGASDFQEYVKGYYGLESNITSDDMLKVGAENFKTKEEVDKEEAEHRAKSNPLNVCITCAESPICYSLLPTLTSGNVFGPKTELNVRLFSNTCKNITFIEGQAMELLDLANGLVRDIEVVQDMQKAFKDCGAIIILDELLREEEETYDDWIKRNCQFFSSYAQVINCVAKKNVRVLVAGNGPVNFNSMMMIKNAPNIPRQNIVALSRAVENRAKAVIGQRLNVNTAGVVDLIIWGNINGQHYIDNTQSRVHGFEGAVTGPPSYSLSVLEMVHDNKWLEKEYLELVKQRRAVVEAALKHSASACEARAINSTMAHWWNGSPHGQMFSLGVYSEGWYNVPEGFVFSYPVTLSPKGYWTVTQDIPHTEETTKKLEEAVKDLKTELEVIYPPPRPPTPPKPETPPETVVEASAEPSEQTEPTGEGAAEPKPEDSTAEPKPEDSTAEPKPEDSTAEPGESGDTLEGDKVEESGEVQESTDSVIPEGEMDPEQ